ncbi:MAG: hypothetical protein AMXMBFR20_01780 [Planctomycetia bacterium]
MGHAESDRACADKEWAIAIDHDWVAVMNRGRSGGRLLGGGYAIAIFLGCTLAGEEVTKGGVADRDELAT